MEGNSNQERLHTVTLLSRNVNVMDAIEMKIDRLEWDERYKGIILSLHPSLFSDSLGVNYTDGVTFRIADKYTVSVLIIAL